MVRSQEVYILQALDFPGEIGDFAECPGNDVLEWYHIGGPEENILDTWVRSQVPEGMDKVLLEWYW